MDDDDNDDDDDDDDESDADVWTLMMIIIAIIIIIIVIIIINLIFHIYRKSFRRKDRITQAERIDSKWVCCIIYLVVLYVSMLHTWCLLLWAQSMIV